ncbi:IIIB 90 kDa subunit [Seminavis robusta]|uniref:B-related factor 1 n=1 Tax=Seminavis robusta TaxID=568900 RepID=A0A9N8EMG8_9STRA|nr:IIIB 90 kDa subunit [Seminavis robusta]|eukprot:Sro1412_g270450.1 IIIB 90 kDa subunit (711) ;mRNA; f:4294-6426
MTSRSVSFGDVEEQYYDGGYDEEYNADDYFQEGAEGADGANPEGEEEQPNNKKGRSSSASQSSIMCPNCGSRNIDSDPASGASVCTECGVVVEESAIVSSVEFVEGAGGSSSMVGQFVSANSSKAFTAGGGGRYGYSKDSRENTLANGRRRIQEVASRLRLGNHFVDAAHRLFTVAVEKNFVQGRRTIIVVASCLYIACRQEKSQHMLIDFSDALQVNVYTIGTTFLKFRRLLGLKLEIIDPALYVYRFAAHLDLDEKANAVAMTALRLVARMKRDWIVTGRRPAGICAAALLIAARTHGFSRHHQDVTRILRVCGLTVNTRVREFENTQTATLTLTQFNNVEFETEADPPIYTKNKVLEARAKAIQENNVELLTSGALDDPLGGKHAAKWRDPKRRLKAVKNKELYKSIEEALAAENDGEQPMLLENGTGESSNDNNNDSDGKAAASGAAEKNDDEPQESSDKNDKTTEEESNDAVSKQKSTEEDDEDDGGGKPSPAEKEQQQKKQQQLIVHPNSNSDKQVGLAANEEWSSVYPRGRHGRQIVLADEATLEEMQKPTAPVEAQLSLSKWKEELPESISDEIESMFRSDEEVAQKEVIFNKINKEYIEQQERKENDRLNSEANFKGREDDEAAQAEGHARYMKSNRGRKKKRSGGDELTTEEALLEAVSNRKISRKINYDAMSAVFDDDGTFATDTSQGTDEQELQLGEL